MDKDEKILKKVGKLLKKYGAEDSEIEKFLLDVQDKKYDDQEETEEIVEEEKPADEGESVEETDSQEVVDEEKEVAPEEGVEEQEQVGEESAEEPTPETDETPIPEEPQEPTEPKVEEPQVEEHNEEVLKTIEGLTARVESLEDLVKKLGVPAEDGFGSSPTNEGAESCVETELDRYNRLRTGR